ncbi:hypothetical protein RUM44_007697 [Polyplax serrata]|uniref:RING-type domain-containing protein n=1 Tax=Polyplax serrata TaxID=468196 RepID=A0ABR1B733_POLSC
MDEWTLNDLLECSVCLERLDTSSKVLPCQHTFCRKCLEEIVATHKELRCPECRVLVDAQIDDLPPNVLLMRILEGIKNSGNPLPKKKLIPFQKQQQQQQPSVQPNSFGPVAYNHVENNKVQPAQKEVKEIILL